AVQDSSPEPLSRKLLERPGLVRRIRALIPDRERAHMIPFNTTTLERDLALALDIPMYGADPRFFPLGTKSGSRRIFLEEGVRHPLGEENLHGMEDVAAAIARLRSRAPHLREVLVKLNEGVSGEGNAFVRLSEERTIEQSLREMTFESAATRYQDYAAKLALRSGIVEERIVGEELRSPSVQLRVTPLGEVELLSTHDQILGGPEGQTYVGCRFPADAAYAPTILREAEKVGRRLAREGVLGRFAIDFVVGRSTGGGWEAYAIEINLRKGGTTHPFLTLQFLTDGRYDPATGVFTTPRGTPKAFVASDHVASPRYRALTPEDLFDVVTRHGLHFDQSRQTGVVLHMMSALGDAGVLGLTAVGDDHAQADRLYQRTVTALDEAAAEAVRP
ncbi:MAG TPA: peptide ligase PGM1-related protein, partial [Candidatus Polarisedimenticolaceae bacterium]|nr:peptide ligase PGM1-related protein [Candidatus Polarisedimenticolaceae bacterium]